VPVGKSSGVSKVAKQPNAGTADANSSGTWNKGVINDVTYITSTIPTASSPNNVQKATQKELIRKFLEMSPQERIGIGNRLKAAGYRVGSLTGKATTDLRNSYIQAYDDLNQEILLGQQLDFNTFLAREKRTGGTDANKTPEPYVQKTLPTKLQIRNIANEVARDLTGRGLSEDQFNRYYTLSLERAKAMPTKTTYTKMPGGGTEATTTGGPDIQEFLYQKIAGTDEAKAKKVFGFYDIFKQALGVD
jgi:hypothetical protein